MEAEIEVREGRMGAVIGCAAILMGILLLILYISHPAEAVFAELVCCLVSLLMAAAGTILCMNARNRKLVAAGMDLCYVNWMGKKKYFSLDEIGYCKTELTVDGSKDFLKIYDLLGEKLCKLDYQMKDTFILLQFLKDNQVRIESSEKSMESLHFILETENLSEDKIGEYADKACQRAKELAEEWSRQNKKLGTQWKIGIAAYQEEECMSDKQVWEQKGYEISSFQNLPEGLVFVLEGYLMKDGEFVLNRKNAAVGFYIPVIRITKSYQIGEERKVRYYQKSFAQLKEQLAMLSYFLPRNKYHTEVLNLQHELKDRISR